MDQENENRVDKRLCKSKKEKMVEGVLGGIAEYFGVNPTLVRVLYVILLVFCPVNFIILYVLLALVMPECEVEAEGTGREWKFNLQENKVVALMLLAVGVVLLLRGSVFSFISFVDPVAGVLILAIALYVLTRREC